jgi:signal transduction histidine kinase
VEEEPGQSLEIVVADHGIGINESQLQRIFAPFVQVDNSSTRQYDGTGLGLALTKRYCELLHGEIRVESHPGQGSVFTVKLPLIYNPEQL